MKRKTIEILFVCSVFILAYTVIAQNTSLTGFAVNFESFEEQPRLQSRDVEYKNFFINLEKSSTTALNELEKGNTIIINKDENKYNMVIMQVVQDYSNSNEIVSLLIMPGERRILIKEGQSEAIDLNNNGNDDFLLTVKDISNGKTTLIFESE